MERQSTILNAQLDLVAALEMYEGTFGTETDVISEVYPSENGCVTVTLTNGESFILRVRTP